MRAIVFVVCLVVFPLTANADSPQSKFTKHYKESIFKVSEKGLFSIEIVIKEKELRTGENNIDIIVHDKNDKDVVDADITVVPWMPDMGHGVSEKPVVAERGGGLYRVDKVMLIMGGHWELRVEVKKGGVKDKAVFDFPDIKAEHDHAMHAPDPTDIDTSTTRISSKKVFSVSYVSKPAEIPMNKIHSWTLKVKTADGKPVKGAKIAIEGDMPEHGHGLPTKPEVTQELAGGVYVVEGMKFSMPGWWILKFHIKSHEIEDSVTFNLLLK